MQTNEKTTLTDLIEEYLSQKAELEGLESTPRPKAPELKKAYTIPEYNSYTNEFQDYKANINVMAVRINNLKKSFCGLKEKILETIPQSHVWFLSENAKYAIAIQRSDWPMDPPKILIKENPVVSDLPKLQLQVVNCN